MTVERVWINQPSTLQPCHELHGKCGLGVDHGNGDVTVYWLNGPVISSLLPKASVSAGWPEHLALAPHAHLVIYGGGVIGAYDNEVAANRVAKARNDYGDRTHRGKRRIVNAYVQSHALQTEPHPLDLGEGGK